jgi:hypothetical protein
MKNKILSTLLACTILSIAGNSDASQIPSQAEMWKIIQEQQKQIKELQSQLKVQQKETQTAKEEISKTKQKVVKVEEQTQLTREEFETVAAVLEGAALPSLTGGHGHMHGAPGWWNKTTIGGYGELHYNMGSTIDQVDFHRYVLFFGHEFNDRIRMFSELELEHTFSGDGQEGEVILEQAFVEFDLDENYSAIAGIVLLPIGILNEVHEPNTFYGVERNPVEVNIIPTTWTEAAVGIKGKHENGISYDLLLNSGLDVPTTGSNAYKVRNGRKKVAKASAETGAVTGRIKYTGLPGLEVAASGQYQQDVSQNRSQDEAPATLVTAHVDFKRSGFGFRALGAQWDIDGTVAEAIGRDEQWGYYFEPSYRFNISEEIGDAGIFFRYNRYDNSAGNGSTTDTEVEQSDFGVNYWPHPNVVLKADVAFINNATGSVDDEILNFGVGFQF